MKTKEELEKRFKELEEQRNTILTEQIRIQGKIELLNEQESEKAVPAQ